MSKVKDVSFITNPVRVLLPDGSRVPLENGKAAQEYLKENFGDQTLIEFVGQ